MNESIIGGFGREGTRYLTDCIADAIQMEECGITSIGGIGGIAKTGVEGRFKLQGQRKDPLFHELVRSYVDPHRETGIRKLR